MANQASYQLSDKPGAYLLPREGTLVAELGGKTKLETVAELYRNLNNKGGKKLSNEKYFSPNLSLMEVDILYDHAKVSSRDVAPVILSDASKSFMKSFWTCSLEACGRARTFAQFLCTCDDRCPL